MRRPLAAAALAALVVLAGCGDDDDTTAPDLPAGADEDAVTVEAQDIDFGADRYEAEAGTVAFEYVNEGVIEHTLVVEGVDDFRLLVETRGDIDVGTVELEPGSYTLICDIPGHEQAGMVADLEVS